VAFPGGARISHDPADPVPTLGGRGMGGPAPSGAFEQSAIEARADVAVFTGPALTRDVVAGGEARVSVEVEADGEVDLAVRLCDVHPDGRSFNVVDAVQRVRGGVVGLNLGSLLHTFRAGHRLRLQVACSNYPRLELHPRHAVDVRLGRVALALPEIDR
jgi:putative CocE/NonD family hydrolase